MAGFISEWWPASFRYGGRHQIGIGGRIASEFATIPGCSCARSFGRREAVILLRNVAFKAVPPMKTRITHDTVSAFEDE